MRASRPLALAVLAFGLTARPARADSPFDGKWRQGPLKEDYTVQKWLNACGPPPVSGATGGGETISIHEEGDELAFVGGGRVYRTNQCYDQMPTLARDAHSRDAAGRSWRTRCVTPPSDPRRALMQTLVVATTDTHLDIVETGRYEITIADGRCVADVKRSRGFDLIAADNAAPAVTQAATSTPPPVEAKRCASPGEPARLEVRPSRKLMRAGDAFAFRTVVLDASGCITRTPTSWALAEGSEAGQGATVDANGNVTVPPDAPEGTFDIIATAAGKSTRVTVEVASPSRYDELLAASGLNDAGESEGASVALIATGSIGGGDARADDGSRRRRAIFLGIVGALAGALAAVAVVGWRRSRRAAALARQAEERHAEKVRQVEERKRERADKHAAAMKAHEESVQRAAEAAVKADRLVCPSCRKEYPAGSVYCANDANRLVPLAGHEDLLAGPAGGICPTCKRGFDPGVKTCPNDGDDLIPYGLYASRNPVQPATRGKICPTCGDRFEGSAAFCGKDGTALVLLN